MGLFSFNKQKKIEAVATPMPAVEIPKKIEQIKFDLLQTIRTDQQNLSLPFIDDEHTAGNSWVGFGESNLYPQIINQLYLTSPMNTACINFKTWSIVGAGYEFEGYSNLKSLEKIRIKTFERKNDFANSIEILTKDYIKHGRAIILLHYNKETKKYDFFKVVDPSEIRNTRVTLFKEVSKYFYSQNWIYRTSLQEITPYKINNENEWQILEIKNLTGGTRSYGLPDYISAANWITVGGDLGLLHKSALENGIEPGKVFIYPYIMSDEEQEAWVKNMVKNQKGVINRNRAMKIEAQSQELMPKIENIQSTDTHQLFEQTSKEQKEETAIAHNINPALMGVRVAGSLGANEEIEFSSRQFKEVWLNRNRRVMENFINDILAIFEIQSNFKFIETELVSMAKKLLESQTEAGLENELENANIVNSNLLNLTGKQMQNLTRIIRKYDKGEITEPIAIDMLQSAFGINEEQAKKYLDIS